MKFRFAIKSALFFISLVAIDQFSKYLIRSSGGFYVCNKNIALGIKAPDYLFFPLWMIIVIALILFLISRSKAQIIPNQVQIKKSSKIWILDFIWNNLNFEIWHFKTDVVALILILSGAVSNVVDRLFFGCVIDFIDLKFWPASNALPGIAGWPVFNLADIFISSGAILLLVKYLKSYYNSKQNTAEHIN